MKMIEYHKLILDKVSFDKSLFKKELKKAFRFSSEEEIQQLKQWVRSRIKREERILVS